MDGQANHVNGQDSARILKLQKCGSSNGGLQPRAVVVRRAVITQGGVKAAHINIEEIAARYSG